MIKTDRISIKLFTIKNIFVFLILSAIAALIIFKKIINFLTKIFITMQLNNVKIVVIDDVQRIINVNLYRINVIVFFITMIIVNNITISQQMHIQIMKNMFIFIIHIMNLENYYNYHKFKH